ncbi:unnamed protein product [Rhizophagus irregularis]|uniref:Uncharacterized protein n=1 Tax=Rhizophagus irregularis TaxID=588596 RepID=A0A915YSR3_9GLOM|nr:unnamed protein product [Rhizophagus irregularis]CAB5322515.1 unnamed protein product [Rhizophagus irregularis]
MFLKRLAIKNARNSRLSLENNNQQSQQQSISSSSDSSLSLTSSSNARRSSNITSIPENIEVHPLSFDEHDDSGKIHRLRRSASSYSFKKVQDTRRHSVGPIYIKQNIEQNIEQKRFEPCCDPIIIKELNELSQESYEIVKCPKVQNDKKWYFKIITKFKKFKIRCHQGQKSHIVTAKRIKNGKMVVIKRIEKKNLTGSDYYKPACNVGADCECAGCIISKLQSSPPLSILSTGSSNPTIHSARITFNEESLNPTILSARITFNEESIIKTVAVDPSEQISLQNFDSTQNSPQTSILNNSSQLNSPRTSVHNFQSQYNNSPRSSIYNIQSQYNYNSPRSSIYNIQSQYNNNSPRSSIYNIQSQYNNNSPRSSIHNIQSQYNNNSPRSSVYNIQSQYNNTSPRSSVYNIQSQPNTSPRSNIPNSVGFTPIVRQIDKLKKESNAFLTSSSSTSINYPTASINSQSQSQSSPALSIKSDSSSMFVQPPSINYIPIELQSLHAKFNEFPAYIDYFDDGRYYYYITKIHGVRQRKLKKPSSWFKKKYFKVNWEEYLNS